MNKQKIAILIPARNEEQLLESSLTEILKVVSKKDVFIVDDGSTDATRKIARKYVTNVLTLKTNVGKAKALNLAIKHFDLINKYQYIFPIDADTKIGTNFVSEILKVFAKDRKKEVVAVIGKIVGTCRSAITSYRMWEYEIAQSIHKRAQEKEGAVIVCSGCATVYRSSLFKKVMFPSGTLTEDMDLTFQINRQKLGKILYCYKATVTTQDPLTIGDFHKQLDRWYTGFWQCVNKHKVPFKLQMLDLEVFVSAIEGILNAVLVLMLIFSLPWIVLNAPKILGFALLFDFLLFLLPTTLICALKYKSWRLFKYLPSFYFLRIFSSLIFLKSFVKNLLGLDSFGKWNRVERYKPSFN